MRTVSEEIESIVAASAFLEEGLARGIINFSALSRDIRPEIEASLMKPVSESAILMALKRLAKQLEGMTTRGKGLLSEIGDLTVRSNLVALTYLRSPTILDSQRRLLTEIDDGSGQFVTFTQGVFETTLVVSDQLCHSVNKIFSDEAEVSQLKNLSAVVIKFPAHAVSTPGVHYSILKQLAWNGIHVVEIISTYTELTLVVERRQIDQAFSVLLGFLSG
ncbi:MAG: aspartate kinase [bacterium]|nr:aspartate kinase [bacterium]